MSFEILTHPRRSDYDLSTVTDFVAGGAPRPPEHVVRMHAEMEGKPLIGYGLTESNGIGSVNVRSNYLAKPDSAGRAAQPLVELILAGRGRPAPTARHAWRGGHPLGLQFPRILARPRRYASRHYARRVPTHRRYRLSG
jgi:acyl-CoA synthetase (AMP-forming)/AMP-acid ligase II